MDIKRIVQLSLNGFRLGWNKLLFRIKENCGLHCFWCIGVFHRHIQFLILLWKVFCKIILNASHFYKQIRSFVSSSGPFSAVEHIIVMFNGSEFPYCFLLRPWRQMQKLSTSGICLNFWKEESEILGHEHGSNLKTLLNRKCVQI